jgi:anti-sigma B factor antagonist
VLLSSRRDPYVFRAVTQLTFNTTLEGDLAAVALSGELDVAGAALLERELDRLLSEHGPSRLALDLGGLDFMDSTGLRLIVLTDARAREHGSQLLLVRGNEDVQRVFEITRMGERLTWVDSVEELR